MVFLGGSGEVRPNVPKNMVAPWLNSPQSGGTIELTSRRKRQLAAENISHRVHHGYDQSCQLGRVQKIWYQGSLSATQSNWERQPNLVVRPKVEG
jgi:hypothetical protein